jgi:release factor glutamine methyltransferase
VVEHGVRLMRQWCLTRLQYPLYGLDVGTGSGNLAISLAWELPQLRVWGIDTSLGALRVAQRNAQRLGVAERLTWVCGDLLTPLQTHPRRFVLCVSNLPYVTTAEWADLPGEIREHEPSEALRGGEDGLDLIRRVILSSPQVLVTDGVLVLEVGWQQTPAVVDLMRQSGGFRRIGVERDFARIERVVWAQVA